MLLGALDAILLENLWTGKGTIRTSERAIRTISWSIFLILLHPLKNFEIQKYYQNKPKFNGVYLRNNLHKIKDGEYVINLDQFKSIGTRWIVLYVNCNNAI